LSIVDISNIENKTFFLSKAEQSIYDAFHFDLRRNSFLAGRWVAKGMIQNALFREKSLREISILNENSGKPYAVIDGERLDVELSISHAGRWAAALLSVDRLQVGVDIEGNSPRAKSFVTDYFSSAECALLDDQSNNYVRNATLIWSAKEAMLKALGLGLRLDTRHVQVTDIGTGQESHIDGWNHLGLDSENGDWVGCWRQVSDAVVVCAIYLPQPYKIDLITI